MANYEKATQPTIYFIGVTTGSSSIMKVFPKWADALGLKDTVIKGIDFKPHSDPREYREAVQRAAGLMREWKEQALLTRKDVRGVIYHMQNHVGGLDELPTGMEETVLDLGDKRAVLRELGMEDEDG